MTKIITLIAFVAIFYGTSKAQFVNIPDSNFRSFLKTNYPGCFNTSDQMDTTCSVILSEDSIDFTFINIHNLGSLEGIQYFKSLEFLNCSGMSTLTNVSFLPASLKKFICNNNFQLTGLPILPPGLEYLDCSDCSLATITELPVSLLYFDCSGNYLLQSLPAFSPSLEYINVSDCQATYLPSPLPSPLKELKCSNNLITSIPPLPGGLSEFSCRNNQVAVLPELPSTLIFLECSNNSLTSLPLLPNGLTTLYCYVNQLTTLPALPAGLKDLMCGGNLFGNYFSTIQLPEGLLSFYCEAGNITALPSRLPSSLQRFHCGANQITQLPALPPTLKYFNCSSNQLTFLPDLPATLEDLNCEMNNIYCLPKLPEHPESDLPTMLMVAFDANKIKCTPNKPRNVNFNAHDSTGAIIGDPPLCNPTNNVNQCQAFPVISGTVFYDNNLNGVKDADEVYKSNMAMVLSNGNTVYTNKNGYFETGVDSLGVYTITATAPSYFNVIPASNTYSFTSYDTIVSANYALQANTTIESLSIRIIPLNWAARPGFSFSYLISYENTGTTTLTPSIVLNYDNTRLSYDSSSNAAVINNTNNLSLAVGSFTPGQQESFVAYFRVNPAAVIDDSISANTIITAGSYTRADTNIVIIQGSYDPNDKQATPQLSPSQVTSGQYIDYTIRFQNTGTDTAFNIVISDTLSEDLQTNTLQMITSSHNCKVTVKDNIVFFEFINILLPDSNVNEPKSHGFVSFRIKPQTTVAVNSTITNKAAIYFDYNAPVITNTAGTLIKEFIVVPLRLVSFNAVSQTDNTTTLYWNTANEINTRQFMIEQSNDGSKFNSLTTVTAKGKANNNYSANVMDANNSLVYYRLKIVDNDGSFSYSPILKIDRRKNTSGIAVMTNPVKDFIIINSNDRSLNNTQCNIINTQGAIMKSFVVKQGNQTVEIKGLPIGMYYLKTISGSSKILVQR